MNTKDGGEDDAADQWEVENYKEMHPEVAKVRDQPHFNTLYTRGTYEGA